MCHILWISPTFSVKLTKQAATTGQEETALVCARGGSGWTMRRISPLKRRSSFPRGGGVTIPGSAQGMTGCCTQCSGLIEEVEINQRLDSVILEVLSNLNDFMFHDSAGLTSTHVHWHTHVCSQNTSHVTPAGFLVTELIEYLPLYKRAKHRLKEILLY